MRLWALGSGLLTTPSITIVVDGAWEKRSLAAYAAWVAYDSDDLAVASHYHRLYATSARQVEATACLLALRWANAISFPSILVITDSELLVRNLRSRKVLDTMVQYTHSDFKLLGSCFDCCKMQKVSRDGVAPAHLLAKAALRNRFNVPRFNGSLI